MLDRPLGSVALCQSDATRDEGHDESDAGAGHEAPQPDEPSPLGPTGRLGSLLACVEKVDLGGRQLHRWT